MNARFTFRYPAFCGVDYYKYPEETNTCCLILALQEMERKVKFEVRTKERATVQKAVGVTDVQDDGVNKIFKNVEVSPWIVTVSEALCVEDGCFSTAVPTTWALVGLEDDK